METYELKLEVKACRTSQIKSHWNIKAWASTLYNFQMILGLDVMGQEIVEPEKVRSFFTEATIYIQRNSLL